MAANLLRGALGPTLLAVLLLVSGALWLRHEMRRGFFHPDASGYPISGDDELPTPWEEVSFSAPGGPRLHGWWLHAEGSDRAVVFLHGNGGDIRERERISVAEDLRGLGQSVLLFDYRGYGRSEGKPTHPGVLADSRAAVAFAADRAGVERVALYGRSLGGSLALCATDASPKVAAVVAEGAFSSASGIVAHYARRMLGGPAGGALTRLLFESPIEPLEAAGEVRVPVLLLHSELDAVVPVFMADELFEALPEGKVELRRVEGETHDSVLATGPEFPAVRAFLARHLGGESEGNRG
jgi:pimeloyl-ACP methyl ester carboxylesterase